MAESGSIPAGVMVEVLDVALERVLLRGAVRAERARERPLARVGAQVARHVPHRMEGLAAHEAHRGGVRAERLRRHGGQCGRQGRRDLRGWIDIRKVIITFGSKVIIKQTR